MDQYDPQYHPGGRVGQISRVKYTSKAGEKGKVATVLQGLLLLLPLIPGEKRSMQRISSHLCQRSGRRRPQVCLQRCPRQQHI